VESNEIIISNFLVHKFSFHKVINHGRLHTNDTKEDIDLCAACGILRTRSH